MQTTEQLTAVEKYLALEKYNERYWKDIRFLEKIVHDFAKKYYELETDIPVKLNGRLGRSLGRFVHVRTTRLGIVTSEKSKHIEINSNFLKHASKEDIAKVVIHEAIHHILFEMNRPYVDGHPVFERALKEHGAATTNDLQPRMEREVYICEKCHDVVATRARRCPSITKKKMSSCCYANIIYAGRKIF